MKYITFAIPSYNSEAYLHHAVQSLLPGGEDVEILIINDGSKDRTGEIADAFASEYPTIVRAIHKENGGHGSGVNRGLQEARGLYYKVVDSDDWVDEKALQALLYTVKRHVSRGLAPDLYYTNYVYNHTQDNTLHVKSCAKKLPQDKLFGWNEVKSFHAGQFLMMHALMYRTQLLRDYGLQLPEKTFYVDNIYAYAPLPQVKRMYYLNVDLYQYFIGRSDQSVNVRNMTSRYQQQIKVMKLMLDAYSYRQLMAMEEGLRRYMLHDLGAIMLTTMMFCCCGKDQIPERKQAYLDLWGHILERDPELHRYLHTRGLPSVVTRLPWKLRSIALMTGYQVMCRLVKLG